MNSVTCAFVVTLATFVGGCSNLSDRFVKNADESPGTARFTLLSAPPYVLRMDSKTGETWRFADNKWISVQDNLQSVGSYNPKTKKLEWGVKAQDGRDLRELSREELIRLVETQVTSAKPGDPLGIR